MNITQGKKKVLNQANAELIEHCVIVSWMTPKVEKIDDYFYVSYYKDGKLLYEVSDITVDDKYNMIQWFLQIH